MASNIPQPPTSLHLAVAEGAVHLSWSPAAGTSEGISSYEIARAELFGGPFVVIGTVGGDTLQYIDATAPPETILYYQVRARAGGKVSDYSQPVSGEVPASLP
ncbi:fibronectin type III domain-containing protein [Desulfuromonas soudanensis]|uniref:fibronectin type III domain-containing protein n=1 Tax=Desulfuromonas soudanensis TaxID=1603606 RepID=UPI0012F8000F|nr:fibronectin type III domain-containing protein [Desulfuromonas soudanensis]